MTDQPLLLALDQGTSSSRAAIFDTNGLLIASAHAHLNVEYPSDGWVQQDPMDIWNSQYNAMKALEQKLSDKQRKSIISCGITNQRETTILWRRSDGKPCGPALVWQDGRTSTLCKQWKLDGLEEEWRYRTGLLLDPYFSASKINWLLRNADLAKQAAIDDDLCFGTVESWLLWQLTGGKRHCSDMSNASRTLLMNIESREWITEYCQLIGLPINSLPELVPCRGNFGEIASNLPFKGIAIQSLLGDQQAATFGQLCLRKGEAKCTYGTGAFLVINTSEKIYRNDSGLLSTLCWTDNKGSPTYCLEGSLFNAGTIVQWLRDGLQIIESAEEINRLALTVEDSEGIMVVPAFTGWGTPYWDPSARGLIIGLTRNSSKGHIARAALEGIALSVSSLIQLAEDVIGDGLSELAVDGGAAASEPLLQAQANCTGIKVRRPMVLESTAKGAALMAGVEAGLVPHLKELTAKKQEGAKTFTAQIDKTAREAMHRKWDIAVKRSLYWNESE